MKKQFIVLILCIVALTLLLLSTDPAKLPSFLLILPFIILYVLLLTISILFLQKRGMARLRSIKVGSLLAGLPLLLLVLQSLGQLTPRDVLVIIILFVLSYFYLSRDVQPS